MANGVESQNGIDKKQLVQKQKTELLNGVQILANNEKDPVKKELMPKLGEKIINDFQAETGYPLKNMQKKIISTGKTVLEELLSQLPSKRFAPYLKIFKKGNPKRPKLFGYIKTQLNIFTKKADKEQKLEEKDKSIENKHKVLAEKEKNIENKHKELTETEKRIAEKKAQIKKMKEGKGDLQTTFGLKDIDEKEQEDLAIAKYGQSREKIEEQIRNTPGRGGTSLSVSDFLNFLNVKEKLKTNPKAIKSPKFTEYRQDFEKMESSLQLPNSDQLDRGLPPVAPVQDLQNLSEAQSAQIIEQTDGMENAIGEVEKHKKKSF